MKFQEWEQKYGESSGWMASPHKAYSDLLRITKILLEQHQANDPHHEDMCTVCRSAVKAIEAVAK